MTAKDQQKQSVIVRQYGLRAPLNWGRDVDDELYRMNALWNTLVDIERANRERYRKIVAESPVLAEISARIDALHSEREKLIAERNRRRAAARSKAKADTAEQDARLKAIKAELAPLYDQRKSLAAQARAEQKPLLDALEAERKEAVKRARQQSGCFWSNYNAVIDSYNTARQKAMKEGAELRFRRFKWEGRLINQIQGGMTVDELFSCAHSQAGIRLTGTSRGRPIGVLYITAYTGHDAEGRHVRRNIEFPIILHRPFPDGAIIKEVKVSIRRRSPTIVRGTIETNNSVAIERGVPEYSVTFTCRAPAPDDTSGTIGVGVNIGWKRVNGGLRVATAVFSDGTIEHLLLPDEWMRKYDHVQSLKSNIDETANAMHAILREALRDMPLWDQDEGVSIEGLTDSDHRLLSAIKRTQKTPTRAMDTLAWRIKEAPNIPFISDLSDKLETWRKQHKRYTLEMDNLRDKLISKRKDMYRVFAARLAARAGAIVLDATSYRDAALVKRKDGDDPALHEQARTQRVMAAPYELRLSIEQAAAKRGAHVERYAGEINHCHVCGSVNISGETVRHCHACSTIFDIDENAARNLLATITAEPARAVG